MPLPSLTYRVTRETLDQLTPEWNALLDESGQRSPFLRPSWQRVWWRELAPTGELFVLSVRDGEQLAGVAPLRLDGGVLSLAGDSSICDYMDIIARPGQAALVLDAVLAEVEPLPWQDFRLWGIRADSPTLVALPGLAAQRGLRLQNEPEAVCPRVSLPATWDAYLERLSKKDRHELRRKLRRFGEATAEPRELVLRTPAEIEAALNSFIHLHTISRPDKAEFMTADMERFFRAMAVTLAAEDLVRMFLLEASGQPVAGMLAFDCGEELWLYNSGFDPEFAAVSVGLVSKALALRLAIGEGKTCYDFLRGAEPYKYHLGAHDLQVSTCTLNRGGTDPADAPDGSAG